MYAGSDYHSVYIKNLQNINQYYNLIGVDNGYEVKFYVDGELQGTTKYTGTPKDSSAWIAIGGNPKVTSGQLDNYSNIEVKKAIIFDKGVKPADIPKLNALLSE